MARRNKKLLPFVPTRRDMMESDSFRGLSSNAKVIYLYLRKNTNGQYGDPVSLPYSQLVDMMSRATISKAFKELIEAGFIERVARGGMYGTANYYRLIGEFANPYYSDRKH